MDEKITAAEVASVLTRLVQDRKRLEKGAEIATALAGMEQATVERKAELTKLDQQISDKKTILENIDASIRDKEFASTMHLQSVESDYANKIDSLTSELTKLTKAIAQAKHDAHEQELELTTTHNKLIATYMQQEQDISSQISSLKTELASLKRQAAVLSGV
jgi:chromosome segregation ATPase